MRRKAGLHVPEDSLVVGFYNTYISLLNTPPISTIYVPKNLFEQVGGEAILNLISNPSKTEKAELPISLVVRHLSDASRPFCWQIDDLLSKRKPSVGLERMRR